MHTPQDHSLPIADEALPDTWELEPQPVSLFLLWPGEQPEQVDVVGLLAAGVGEEPSGISALPADSEVRWGCVCEFSRLNQPVLLWCEAAKPVSSEDVPEDRAKECRWVIGVQTALDFEDPIADFASLIHLLAKAFPECPALFDADVGLWHSRGALDRFASHAFAVPANELLWTIHVVSNALKQTAQSAGEHSAHAWIHTHGLARCGLPDLELLGVPEELLNVAAQFLNLLVELVMEMGLPDPGEIVSVGEGIEIAFVPVHTAVRMLEEGAPGGKNDRGGPADAAHMGTRAVVCDPKAIRAGNPCPVDALRKIAEGSTTLMLGDRATLRRARLASHHWDDFVQAWNAWMRESGSAGQRADAEFHVKVGVTAEKHGAAGAMREHLWIRVVEIDAGRIRGELLVQSMQVQAFRKGDVRWFGREDVSDWRITTRGRSCAPGQML
ncbi:MAG TPA: DUF2314 domain-containing protein [Phycisphaerales bacterium]|nr:DUF2314 domain-containing protein [Phycisphaerales bacterium]